MSEREYVDDSGTPWTFVERRQVRRDEADHFVVVVATSPFETRVIHCERERWLVPEPDFAALLAESLPAGGSRGAQADPHESTDSPDEELFNP